MREMTASEASRNFSALLDAVEDGESFVVTRGGRQIATVTRAPQGTWAAFAEAVKRHRAGRPPDDDDSMERALDRMRELVSHEYDADPWAD